MGFTQQFSYRLHVLHELDIFHEHPEIQMKQIQSFVTCIDIRGIHYSIDSLDYGQLTLSAARFRNIEQCHCKNFF